MKPLPHRYEANLAGGPSGYAQVSSAGVPVLRTAAPAEFDGPGDAWSPEQLLLASVQSCYLFTLRAVARASHVEFHELQLKAEGIVDRQAGITRFSQITLRPRLSVPPDADPARLQAVLDKTAKACLVSASLATPIRIEPDIRVTTMAASVR